MATIKVDSPVLRHAYSESCRESDLKCEDPSLTQQHFRDEADINTMLERFKVTGQMPQGVVMPSYGDFTGLTTYQEAMNVLLKAQNAFMEMPANVRARFGNDPGQFMEFCADPANLEEARRLGVAVPAKPDVEPLAVRVVAPAPAPEPSKAQ